MYRSPNEFSKTLAGSFIEWGIPTVESILNVKKVSPELLVFASGGLKNGLDIAKCVALGATLGGMAGNFLKAAAISTEKVIEIIKLTKKQLEVAMFTSGARTLKILDAQKLQSI
jgi:L-lactate dehydrogenase (FMN-dependent) and related alpha-hydroxy acid dehydrogenases